MKRRERPKNDQNSELKKPRDVVGWILAIIAMALYANTLGHGFAFDDSIVITENGFTQKGLAGIMDLMTTDFFQGIYGNESIELTGGRYRPLSLVMFAMEYQFFGLNPFVGHCMNVLLYSFTVLLMYKLFHRWFSTIKKRSVFPLLATIIFAIHPIHTEVVANIKSRDEILALLLMIITFYCIENAQRKLSKNKWLAISVVSFFLSMLAKESAFTFVVLIPLVLFVVKKMTIKGVLKFSIPYWVAAALYFALRSIMVGGMGGDPNPDIMENPFIGASIVEKYATISVILLKYLVLLLFPHPLSCDYSFNQIPWTNFANLEAILGLISYAVMVVYAVKRIRNRDFLALCFFMFFIPLSITTNVLFNIGAPLAERFLYMPSLGFCLAIAYLMNKVFRLEDWTSLTQNRPLIIGLSLVCIVASGKTVMRNFDWKNNLSLFEADIKTVPNSAKIHYYYGNANFVNYLNSDKNSIESKTQLDLAEQHFKQAVRINPKFHTAMYNIGSIYDQKQNGPMAEEYLIKTLALAPRHIKSHDLLAKVYARYLNQPAKSLHHLHILINEAGSKTASNYQLQGVAFGMQREYEKATESFEKAIILDPNNAQTLFNYGVTLGQMGQSERSMKYLNRAIALDPSLKQ